MVDKVQKSIQKTISFLMGKVGEKLVERLFHDLNFDIYPNGFEAVHPAFVSYMRKRRVHKSQFTKYRVRADFAVIKESPSIKDGLCCEIEIKFRSSGAINRHDLKAYDKDVRFILISRDHFWSATHAQVEAIDKKKLYVGFDEFTLLEDDQFYQFSANDRKLIGDFKKLIAMFMPPQKEGQPSAITTPAPLPAQPYEPWTVEESRKLSEEYRQLLIIYSHDEAVAILCEEFERTADIIAAELAKAATEE